MGELYKQLAAQFVAELSYSDYLAKVHVGISHKAHTHTHTRTRKNIAVSDIVCKSVLVGMRYLLATMP